MKTSEVAFAEVGGVEGPWEFFSFFVLQGVSIGMGHSYHFICPSHLGVNLLW